MSETVGMESRLLNLTEELYRGLDRLGPGDEALSRTALGFVGTLAPDARIADIGCGTGAQTLVLAAELAGRIIAVDFLKGFLDELDAKIVRAGLSEQVKTLHASMEKLPFKDAELDLIWSEGAVYNMGFKRGLREWFRFLKPGGHLVLTEISWLTKDRPAELEDYWASQYAEMDTVSGKLRAAEDEDYAPVACFALPSFCWTKNYYTPLAAREETFLRKYRDDPLALGLVEESRRERGIYERYGNLYGYVFYVLRKRPAMD